MKKIVRDALDRLMLDVQTEQGYMDIATIEAELLSHEDLLRSAKGTLEEIREDLRDAQLELARVQEFTA